MGENKNGSKRQNIIIIVSICIVLAVVAVVTIIWNAVRKSDIPPQTDEVSQTQTDPDTPPPTEPVETEPKPGDEYKAIVGNELWEKYIFRLIEKNSGGNIPSGIVVPFSENEEEWLQKKFYSPAPVSFSDGTYTYTAEGDSIIVTDASGNMKYTGAGEYDQSAHYIETDGSQVGLFTTAKHINIIGGKLIVIRQVDKVVRVAIPEKVIEALNKLGEEETDTASVSDTLDASGSGTEKLDTAPEGTPVTEDETSADTTAVDGTNNESESETVFETEYVYSSADTVTVVQSYTYVEIYTVSGGIPALESTHIMTGAYDGFDYNADSTTYRFYCDYDIFGSEMTDPAQYIPFYVTPDGVRHIYEPERIQPADSAAVSATYAGSDVVTVVRIKSGETVDDYMAVYQIGYTSAKGAIAAGE